MQPSFSVSSGSLPQLPSLLPDRYVYLLLDRQGIDDRFLHSFSCDLGERPGIILKLDLIMVQKSLFFPFLHSAVL